MTLTIHTNFHSLFLRMLHKKFGFDWPSGFSLGEKPGLYFWSSKCPLKSPPHATTSHWQNHHCFPPVAFYLSFFSALFDYIKQTLQISSPHWVLSSRKKPSLRYASQQWQHDLNKVDCDAKPQYKQFRGWYNLTYFTQQYSYCM